jgi:hypothetical protein
LKRILPYSKESRGSLCSGRLFAEYLYLFVNRDKSVDATAVCILPNDVALSIDAPIGKTVGVWRSEGAEITDDAMIPDDRVKCAVRGFRTADDLCCSVDLLCPIRPGQWGFQDQ